MPDPTVLTPKVLPGKYPGVISALGADFVLAASDAANGNRFISTGKEIIVAFNSGAEERTLTITSVNDPFRRTQDITDYAVGIGLYSVFGPFPVTGWIQTTGYIHLLTSHAELKIAIFTIP